MTSSGDNKVYTIISAPYDVLAFLTTVRPHGVYRYIAVFYNYIARYSSARMSISHGGCQRRGRSYV